MDSDSSTTNYIMNPKRSYDFDKFSLLAVSDLQHQQQPQSTITNISESTDTTTTTKNNNKTKRDPPKVQIVQPHKPNIDQDSSSFGLNRNLPSSSSTPELKPTTNISQQRKRSYDVRSSVNYESSIGRRHSMARVQNFTVEAPITKVKNLLILAQDHCKSEIVRDHLEKALEILGNAELYNPSSLMNDFSNDKQTTDLVSGLMSNGFLKKSAQGYIPTVRSPLFSISSCETQSYIRNLSPEVNNLLDSEKSWSFDIISLERLTLKRPLVTLGLKILNRFDTCSFLKTDETTLLNWLTLMESHYKSTNPYHNSTHASDVLHSSAYFVSTDKLKNILDTTDRIASLLAAVIHDLNHPGRTNAFLCNSKNELAVLYNDQ
jgi:high affinity cAMP-specific and IBMX-insensitive 3',5'-cyclic phosphodiesterase 8